MEQVDTKELDAIKIRIAKTVATLTKKAAIIAVNFSKERFRMQNWLNGTAAQWKARKNNVDPGRGILVGKGTAVLKKDVQVITTDAGTATVGTSKLTEPYARAHNFGFNGTVNVREHYRRRTRKIKEQYVTGKGKTRNRTRRELGPYEKVKAHKRNMNLPQRQFMGKSVDLDKQIEEMFETELKEAIKG